MIKCLRIEIKNVIKAESIMRLKKMHTQTHINVNMYTYKEEEGIENESEWEAD